MFRLLARLNKWLLPSLTKRGLDPVRASKFQKALLAWRYWVTVRALNRENHPKV